MNLSELAFDLDRHRHPIEAAAVYELRLQEPGATLKEFLNAAVLYFTLCDAGAIAHYSLHSAFVDFAWSRANSILEVAIERFGQYNELRFWQKYFPYILLGGEDFADECLNIAREGPSLAPYVYLYAVTRDPLDAKMLAELLSAIGEPSSERERYLHSVGSSLLGS